jgi:hypothetical protein
MPSRDQFFAALGSPPVAIALLTALRWPQGIACPHCGRATVGGHGRYNRCRDLPPALVRAFFGNPEVAYVKEALSW